MNPFRSLNQLLYCLTTCAGIAAVVCGVTGPWFGVPVSPAIGASSPADIVLSTPGCTPFFKAAVAVGLIVALASWVWKRRWSTGSAFITSLMLLLPLTYPYFVMIRSPQISADATWLQMQHNNLTWLGGDIFLNAEFGSKGWRTKTYFVDTPRHLAVVNLPSWSPWEIGLHRTKDLLLWLGYSNAFCQFVGRGWSLSIVGSFLLVLSTFQHDGRLAFERVSGAITLMGIVAVVAVCGGWARPFHASQEIRSAAQSSSQHDYAQSKKHLDRAVELLPVLGQDTHYISQRGVLDRRLGIDSPYAALQRARGLETGARYDEAFAIYKPLTASTDPAIGREALRGVLRFAIQDFNSARFERATRRFTYVLRRTPCDVKLIYLMQLSCLRQSRVERVNTMRDWMYSASNYYNFGTKKILRAVAQQHSATATGLTADANAIWAAQTRAKNP